MKLSIAFGSDLYLADLLDIDISRKFTELLPVNIKMNRWGDEYYGTCGLQESGFIDMSDAREIMKVGEIAYWPSGDALCFFFGLTPVSTDDNPRAVSPVIPIGTFTDSVDSLKTKGTIELVAVSAV